MQKLFVSVSAASWIDSPIMKKIRVNLGLMVQFKKDEVVLGKFKDYWLVGTVQSVISNSGNSKIRVKFYQGGTKYYSKKSKFIYKLPKLTTKIKGRVAEKNVLKMLKKYGEDSNRKHMGKNLVEFATRSILYQFS